MASDGAITYRFLPVLSCDMCGAPSDQFRMRGMRLNGSQGLKPKRVSGIAVSIKQCGQCGLIFPDPQPIPPDILDHYRSAEEYWAPEYFVVNPTYFATEIANAKRLLGQSQSLSALDIGAGIGKAMKAMSNAGFDVWGVEPLPSARKAAIELIGIPEERISVENAETSAFDRETFDFITFGAVLEHLYSPSLALAKALEWIKPGGIIQAEVPSTRHLIPRIVNRYYQARGTNYVSNTSPMHSPFHLYEFTLEAFRLHGRRLGYEIAHHEISVCDIFHFPRIVHPLLRAYMAATGTGMQLTVYLRRASSK